MAASSMELQSLDALNTGSPIFAAAFTDTIPFKELPTEIVQQILQHVDPISTSACTLLQSNKNLFTLTAPRMYRHLYSSSMIDPFIDTQLPTHTFRGLIDDRPSQSDKTVKAHLLQSCPKRLSVDLKLHKQGKSGITSCSVCQS